MVLLLLHQHIPNITIRLLPLNLSKTAVVKVGVTLLVSENMYAFDEVGNNFIRV